MASYWVTHLDVLLISVEFRNIGYLRILSHESRSALQVSSTWPSRILNSVLIQKRLLSLVLWEGNLAATNTLAAKYRGGGALTLCAQLLCYPPLEGRVGGPSYEQFANEVSDSERAQSRILRPGVRERRDTKNVSIYGAPEYASWLDVR